MTRVLQVFGEPLSNGGQEAFAMNMYRNIDRSKVQFDFYTPFFCDNKNLEEEIKKLGGKVFASNGRFFQEGNKKDFIMGLENFLKEHKYEIIHINSGSIFNLAFGAKIAKKYGTKKVIVHSHATGIKNIKYRMIKLLSTNIFLKNVDKYIACSQKAAEWKFPKRIMKKNQYTVIKNGIELEKFIYNEQIRKEYRNKLNINENDFVIGNVGRLELHKNHKYLIDVFQEVLKYIPDTKLIIVGNGTMKEEMINLIKKKNIEDNVILLERRKDINNILQAMDIFVFPSIFEGLGIVAIEAQAAGLVTVCSENIPREAAATELFKKLDLSTGKEIWAKEILKNKSYKRSDYTEKLKEQGYDAKDSAKCLQNIYLEENN